MTQTAKPLRSLLELWNSREPWKGITTMTAMDTPPTGSGRVAVITGGAGAIGSAIASALRRSGHQAVVVDRTGDVICDLASEQSTRQAAAEVLARYGRCDVFVHCAAVFDQGALADIDLATWRHVQAVNV